MASEMIFDGLMEATRMSFEEAVLEASRASLQEAGGRHGDLHEKSQQILQECGEIAYAGGVPTTLRVHFIEPGGWCFYDSVCAQIPVDDVVEMNRYNLAACLLENLCDAREEFSPVIEADAESYKEARALVVSEIDEYMPLLLDFTDFDFYVLDKLEAVLQQVQVLDTRRYADYPEIKAFAKEANVTMLLMSPGSVDEAARLVTPSGHYVTLSSVSALAEVLRTGDFDFFMVHYQAEGFEHYDAISCGENMVWSLRPESRSSMQHFLQLWSLPSFLAADDLVGARQHMLKRLGHSLPRENDISSDVESSSMSASSPEDLDGGDAVEVEAPSSLDPLSARLPATCGTTIGLTVSASSIAPVETGVEEVPPPPDPSGLPKRRRREHHDCKSSSCPSITSSAFNEGAHARSDGKTIAMTDAEDGLQVSAEVDGYLTYFLRTYGALMSSEGQACEPSAQVASASGALGSSKGKACESSAQVASEVEDEFSDVSSDSDIFNAEVYEAKSWTTEQDEDTERIDYIASLLRSRPLLPPHPQNPYESWRDTDTGVAFPRLHCAFAGCSWTDRGRPEALVRLTQDEKNFDCVLAQHLQMAHSRDMRLGPKRNEYILDYYCAAVAAREREHMPSVGVSIDRRTFKSLSEVYNSTKIRSLVCFVCAQVRLDSGGFKSDITYRDGKWLWKLHALHPPRLDLNLGLRTFLKRYAPGYESGEGVFARAKELCAGNWEWQRTLLSRTQALEPIELLCCPEDHRHCGGTHAAHEVQL